MDFTTMMALEEHGPDTYVGVGPRYPWGGLYGGQIVAQALRAAAATVDPAFHVHSLHAYFIRRGDQDEPVRYEVDRLRNGRSFVTRQVVARQSIGAILNLSASFQVDEDAAEVQPARLPDDLPGPDGIDDSTWSEIFERRSVSFPGDLGVARAWLRMREPLGDDPLLHACALAYVSDDMPTEAIVRLYPDAGALADFEHAFMTASLDHAIWFHRRANADEWQAHVLTAEGLRGARGLAVGRVFDRSGAHLATVTQEVLLRHRRPVG